MMQGYEKTKVKVAGQPQVETERDVVLPQSMMMPHPDRVPMRIYAYDPQEDGSLGGYMRYKNGGLHSEAERVRKAGRRDDSILIHVNKDEFNQMRQQFGDPIINPQTGLPEYGFFSSLTKVLKAVAPIALSIMVPGAGAAIGGALGLGSGALASTVGNALLGAGVGGITGGRQGAITGSIGSLVGSGFGDTIGKSMSFLPESIQGAAGMGVLGAGSAALTGQDPLQGALGSMAAGSMGNMVSGWADQAQNPLAKSFLSGAGTGVKIAGATGNDPIIGGIAGGALNAASMGIQRYQAAKRGPMPSPLGSSPAAGQQPAGALQAKSSMPTPEGMSPATEVAQAASPLQGATFAPMPINPAALSTAISQLATVQTKEQALQQLAANPDQRPVYEAMKNFTMCDTSSNFGACLAQNWGAFQASISQNAPKLSAQQSPLVRAKTGGAISRLAVGGPGDGQDDLIPAQLADGDFIFPADVVSALGSGSTDAGVSKLDEWMQQMGGSEPAEDAGEGAPINALLSNGEYRIPRAVVAAIGGGSVDAGAKQLEQLMKNIRRSYRSAPVDDIPAKAKTSPLQYMKRV